MFWGLTCFGTAGGRTQNSPFDVSCIVANTLQILITQIWQNKGRFTPNTKKDNYLRKEVMFLPDFVCLSVCQQDNSKSYGRIFLKFWGYVGDGTNYPWFNFGGDPQGILDSRSLWNFRYHCFQWGIRETAAKPNMALPPSEQHCLGGGVRALTAF